MNPYMKPPTEEQRIERLKKKALVNIRLAFGALPLEAINKLTDKEILSRKHIGPSAFLYIRSHGRYVDWKKLIEKGNDNAVAA